ncbi:MAG: hypothetical protein WCB10_15080 [Steroidobacteraceae bacterium]
MLTTNTSDRALERARKYLSDVLGVTPKVQPWQAAGKVPYGLQDKFKLYELELLGRPLLLAVDKNEGTSSLAAMHRQLGHLRTLSHLPVVYVADGLASYERRRLIEQKVPFIVAAKQLYLPDVGIDLREHFRTLQASRRSSFSPATQALFIASLLRRPNQSVWQPAEIGAELGYTAMTVSRAVSELTTAGIGMLRTQGKTRSLHTDRTPAETWELAAPYLRSPVRRSPWVRPASLLQEAKLAGVSALARFSSLVEPDHPVFALDAVQWKVANQNGLKTMPEPAHDACQCQVWTYTPALIRNSKTVDPLSLALSLKNEHDDRIQLALDELKSQFPW